MKNYFIDLDNTLFYTEGTVYTTSRPIQDRIDYINQLKKEGNHITIWTARGSKSMIDYTELTAKQLNEWGVNYDRLLLGKPVYDIYLDDKSFNIDSHLPIPKGQDSSKKVATEMIETTWGTETILVDRDEYCGKLLSLDSCKKITMQYHLQKTKTWYVTKGRFIFSWINKETGLIYSEHLNVGDVVTNEKGESHQIYALEDGELIEISSKRDDSDRFLISKPDLALP